MRTELLQTRSASREEMRRLAATGQLCAVLDACDAPPVPAKAEELGAERAVSLYGGSAEENYWAFAPYLARVDGDLLDWIVETLWQEPWGIFAVADGDLDAVRRHFRRFLIVEHPDGGEMYFRFYDPRVLRKFLATCTGAELRELYGPVQAYAVTDGEGCLLLREQANNAKPLLPPYRPGKNGRLKIRPSQLQAFQPEAEAAFEQRLVAHLREEHTAVVSEIPDELLRELAKGGIARARRYGLTWESDLTAFVAIMFEVAPNFDEHWRIRSILTDPGIPPDMRLDALLKRTRERTWEEAERLYDEEAWFAPAEGDV